MAESEEQKKLRQAKRRLHKAKRGQDIHRPRIDDIYRYMAPWRRKHYETQPNPGDVDEIFDSTGQEVMADFAADMGAMFTPMREHWIELQPVREFGQGQRKQVDEQLQEYLRVVFDHIERSNFHEAVQEAYPDLFAGTMAMSIEDVDPSGPIHCEAVPLPELLIDRGPFGVGARFRQMRVRVEDIQVIWPDAELPRHLKDRMKTSPESEVDVTWGLWRDQSADTETWEFILWEGGHSPQGHHNDNAGQQGEVLLTATFEGQGACPLIVARWEPDGVTAYGVGPGHKALPDVKTKNKTRELVLRNADLAVDPPFFYDDDGVMNFSQGIQPGMGYPKMPNSQVDTLDPRRDFNVGFMVDEDLRMSILRAGFQDKPLQLGKTPPTATQFMEEQRDKAQRMGAPAGRLITEWQYPIFRRFAYLLEQRGVLPEVELNGEQIQFKPVSPLTRQQQTQQALDLTRYVEQVVGMFPQAAAAVVSPFEYANRLADLQGVNTKDLINDPQNLVNVAEQLGASGILQGAAGGGGR